MSDNKITPERAFELALAMLDLHESYPSSLGNYEYYKTLMKSLNLNYGIETVVSEVFHDNTICIELTFNKKHRRFKLTLEV